MALRRMYHHYYLQWLKKRSPVKMKHTLFRKNIFIFPSLSGLGFLFVITLLWLLGTNYENNLIIALAFLLLSLMHTCIFYTYVNLSGLSIDLQGIEPCFAGEQAKVTLRLSCHDTQRYKGYFTLNFQFPGSPMVTVDLLPQQAQTIVLLVPTSGRGWNYFQRLSVSTFYPLGLIRAWSRLDLGAKVVVYPHPVGVDLPTLKASELSESNSKQSDVMHYLEEVDDLSHLRAYQYGDSPRHIAWKAYAKNQRLVTKVYEYYGENKRQQWLNWDDFSGLSIEQRLSCLCHCVLGAEKKHIKYGLRLPNKELPLGSGLQHQALLLRELALYQMPAGESLEGGLPQ